MEYGNWETQAAAALEKELSRSRPSDRLSKLLDEQTVLPEVEFEQRWMAICSEARNAIKDVDAEFRALAASRAAEQRPADLVIRSTTIDTTFSASGPNPYTLQWTQVPGPSTPSDHAVATDVNAGTFYADRSRVNANGQVDAFAGIGVGIAPEVASCRLWVRPYVNWRGYELFGRRIIAPGPGESLLVAATVQLGIIIQSTTLSGGDFRTDAQTWPNLWSSSYLGPVNQQVWHSGTAWGPATWLEAPASNTRRYAVWVVCRAIATGTVGQRAIAYADANTNCTMPWLMVGQVY